MSSIAVANGPAEIESVRREETAMLHEEVDRLPESLRVPIVLCYLEGLTHGEVASRLRWPIGTVRSRMARARGLLRARLTRRGLAYAAILAAIESPRVVRAEVPHALAHTTARSAIELATGTVFGFASTSVATLMEEVLKAMFITQVKRIVATAFAASAIATGAGIIAMGALQPRPSGTECSSGTGRRSTGGGGEPGRANAPHPRAAGARADPVLVPDGRVVHCFVHRCDRGHHLARGPDPLASPRHPPRRRRPGTRPGSACTTTRPSRPSCSGRTGSTTCRSSGW